MSKPDSIELHLNSQDLQSFCQKLMDRSHDIARTHDSLVTLETFVTLFARDSQGSEAFQNIEAVLKSATEKSRQALLKQSSKALFKALTECNAMALAAVHAPLSRNGFYDILKDVIADLSDDDIRVLIVWVSNWVSEARQLAEQASGYPEAYDFVKAGISIEEYQAMNDIDRVLNPG